LPFLVADGAEFKEHIAPPSIGIHRPDAHGLRVRLIFRVAQEQDSICAISVCCLPSNHTPTGVGTISTKPVLTFRSKHGTIILMPTFRETHTDATTIAIGFKKDP